MVNSWELIEKVYDRFAPLDTGGHIFVLGTVQQRWLTRPLVAFPHELKPEEKNYYREFQFQAQTEADADNMLDLQANRWLSGIGGLNLYRMIYNRTMPTLKQAIAQTADLVKFAVNDEAAAYLTALNQKLRAWKCIMANALNVINFQMYIDITDYTAEVKDHTPVISEQGDIRFYKMSEIIRKEINNTITLIDILSEAEQPILHQAPTKEFENIMLLGPDLIDQLKKKITIMENHRRDIERLYKSYNK